MRTLTVEIEINGSMVPVGEISGSSDDAQFSYLDSYLQTPESKPISLSLPLPERKKLVKKFFKKMEYKNI